MKQHDAYALNMQYGKIVYIVRSTSGTVVQGLCLYIPVTLTQKGKATLPR